MSRNLIFDWSGTLVDDLSPVLEATNRILLHYGRPELGREEFRRAFRLPFDGFWAEQLPGVGLDELDPLYHEFFHGLQDQVDVLPGSREILAFCRASGRRVFLLSSIKRAHWETQANRLGLASFFEEACVEVMDKTRRIGELLGANRLDPSRTLFVGDMVHDIETARSAGVLAVATLTGFDPPDQLAAANPDITVRDLRGLHRLLASSDPGRDDHPVATVGALIRDDSGRVLMIRTHKWSDKWGIPGGKIRRGESAADAVRREIREETALAIDDIRFVMVQDCVDSREFERPAHFLLLNYTARARDGVAVRLNNEAEEWRWLPVAEALALDLNQPTRTLIEEVVTHGA